MRARWRQGLELLKALTERGNGRLKNLDARLEELDGQIREQAAYLEKVRQNGKRKKELEERKKEREQFLPVLRAAAGAWEEAKRSGDAVPELDRVIQECTEWERQYGSLEQDQSRLAEMDRSREEEAGGLECLLKRQAELDQELLAEKREIRSLSEADGERERLLGRQTGLQNRRNGLEGKFSQWKEVRERLAGNRERLSRLLEQEAGERERKDVLEQSLLEMEGAEAMEQAMVHEAERCTEQRRKLDLLDRGIRDGKERLRRAEDSWKQAGGQWKAAQADQSALKETGRRLHETELSLAAWKQEELRLTERLASVKQFYGRMERLDAMFQELERAQKEYEQAAAVHGRVQAELGIMEQLFYDAQAGLLARNLTEGEKCPVCGSVHHPEPARLLTGAPEKPELDRKKKEADRVRQAMIEASAAADAGRPAASGRGGEPEGRGRGAVWHGHVLRRPGMEDVFPEPGRRRDQGRRDSAGCREGAGGSHDTAPGAEIQGGTGECQAGDHASRAPEGRGKGQGGCDGSGNCTFGSL